jgi:uncharacterized SAM-binding protein YcdF (DUF218 family)
MPVLMEEAAKEVFDYSCLRDMACGKADLIIGFGHFDMNIPRQCARLYLGGYAKRILFTGGRGAGSADLEQAESITFKNVLLKEFSDIPEHDVLVENESTNTGENIRYSAALLRETDNGFCFENGISNVIAVASPYRQRRVFRTVQKVYPNIRIYNMPPETTFEKEVRIFEEKGENFIQLLLGEVERIICYPKKGYMQFDEIPKEIMELYHILKKHFI